MGNELKCDFNNYRKWFSTARSYNGFVKDDEISKFEVFTE